MPDRAFLNRFPEALDPLLGVLPTQPGVRVLDVGCGKGDLTRALAARLPNTRWQGVDVDPLAIAMASRGGGGNTTTFVLGDGTALPFGDGTFDACLCNLLLHARADRRAIVAEMVRVTKRGGRVVLSDPDVAMSLSCDPGDPELGPLRLLVESVLAARTLRLGRHLPEHLAVAGCQDIRGVPGGILVPGGPALPEAREARIQALQSALETPRPHPGAAAENAGITAQFWTEYVRRLQASLKRRLQAVQAGGMDPLWDTVSACGASGSVVATGTRP